MNILFTFIIIISIMALIEFCRHNYSNILVVIFFIHFNRALIITYKLKLLLMLLLVLIFIGFSSLSSSELK